MIVRRSADPVAFTERAGTFLAASEAEHNLALGLVGRLRDEPQLYGHDPWFAVAEDAGLVVGCALRTPPHGVVLCRCERPAAAAAIAEAARDSFDSLPGLVGPSEAASRFAETWQRLTGAEGRVVSRQRIHACTAVEALPEVDGRIWSAAADDRETIVAWIAAFAAEALPDGPYVESAEASYERRRADPNGAWLVWDDAGPVSFAGVGNATPQGIRVGPVYTPPEHRGRGYATALTAALTRGELARGRRACFLYTDLANPTSNAIYRRIGYRPVSDVDQWAF